MEFKLNNNLNKRNVKSNSICFPLTAVIISLLQISQLNAQPATSPSQNIPTSVAPVVDAGAYPVIYNMTFGEPRNYIRTIIPDQPSSQVNTSLKHRQNTDFFDGLGRPLQTVIKSGHADGNDIVSHHFYDAVGRESIQYLPYARLAYNSQGNFNHTPKYNIELFYPASQGEQPYSITEYDNSPLNRPIKKLASGKSWVGSGRGVETDATINVDQIYSPGGIQLSYYKVTGAYPRFEFDAVNNSVSYLGTYPAGTLFVNKVKDEDGQLSEEIKDLQGRLLMTRSLARSQRPALFPIMAPVDLFPVNYNYTFYIYDDLDRLRIIMPPGIVSPTFGISSTTSNNITTNTYSYSWSAPNISVMNNLAYFNRYDGRGNIIEKKIPGKDVQYFVYDVRDRMVLSQDGNLRVQNKWAFSFYDALDRPTVTGLVALLDSRESLQIQATEPASVVPHNHWRYYVLNYYNGSPLYGLYPPSLSGAEMLTYRYYDNYNFVTGTFDGSKIPNLPANDASIVASVYSANTKGMLTGTRVKVLNPNNVNTNQWINTAYYYDIKGRIIQTVANNLKGGVDYNSNLYYFQGMPYQSVLHHHNPESKAIIGANAALNHIKISKTYRRNLGQGGNDLVWQVQQTINDGTPYNLAYYEYDHLGRNVIKQFPMVNILQEYNIRGWLKLIHARNPMYTDSTYFRENLYYDNGFESKRYNGSISGITWNNYGVIPADNSKRNAYGYSYDKLGRLTHAEYRNNPTISSNWENNHKDFTVSEINYDDRGNILTMVQMGNDINGPVTMDKLYYEYDINTNRLKNIRDDGDVVATLPDFKDNAQLSTEYTYDANGNLISDANKGISSITYNHLDKPVTITIQGKGTISYVYDATGNVLQKLVHTSAPQSLETWDYLSGLVYKDSTLQYIMNEEGRSRPEVVSEGPQTGSTKFVYDYFIKDHVGNVRTTLAADPSSHQYYARHEMATANSEQLIFDNIAAVRDDKPGSINMDDRKAARLNAAETDRSIGTAIMLRVMPGDKFTFAADAYYEENLDEKEYQYTGAEEIVSSLLATLTGGTVGGKPVSETQNGKIINDIFSKPETMTGIQQLLDNVSTPNTAPRAGLNYLFFDEQMNLLSGSGRLVLDHTPTVFTNMAATVETGVPGYVIVYVDNQTIGKDVWFDNVQVLHYNTHVLEESHYYPFGLATTNSAVFNINQPLKYQGKELVKSFGIEMYDFSARMYDPQLGRTWQPDPMAEKRVWMSPYSWVQNDPVNRIDPSGAIDGPVFWSNGDYRGPTAEGIQGNIIIYDGNLDFEKMTEKELLESDKSAKTLDQKQEEMDNNTEAHLLTNLAGLAEGMVVKDRTFTMKSLDRGKIVYGAYTKAERLSQNKAVPNFVTSPYTDGTITIAYLAEHFKNYESTYANMISTIIVHEWSGHGKDKYMTELKTHHKAYWDVINHPTWDQTTNEYKAFNLMNYKFYLEVETKQGLDPNTQKLYDKYIQYYKRPANYKGPKK